MDNAEVFSVVSLRIGYLVSKRWCSRDAWFKDLKHTRGEPSRQILNRNFYHISPHANVCRIAAHTINPNRSCCHPIDVGGHKPQWCGHYSRKRSAYNGHSLPALSHCTLIQHEQSRLAVNCKILTVVLEHIVASKSVVQQVFGSVDHIIIRI